MRDRGRDDKLVGLVKKEDNKTLESSGGGFLQIIRGF